MLTAVNYCLIVTIKSKTIIVGRIMAMKKLIGRVFTYSRFCKAKVVIYWYLISAFNQPQYQPRKFCPDQPWKKVGNNLGRENKGFFFFFFWGGGGGGAPSFISQSANIRTECHNSNKAIL